MQYSTRGCQGWQNWCECVAAQQGRGGRTARRAGGGAPRAGGASSGRGAHAHQQQPQRPPGPAGAMPMEGSFTLDALMNGANIPIASLGAGVPIRVVQEQNQDPQVLAYMILYDILPLPPVLGSTTRHHMATSLATQGLGCMRRIV